MAKLSTPYHVCSKLYLVLATGLHYSCPNAAYKRQCMALQATPAASKEDLVWRTT